MTGTQKFRKGLLWVFWISLIFSIGFSWFYVKRLIPDQLSIVADEVEQFHFSLPIDVTIGSESEEVVLSNESNIPSNQLRLQLNQPFSLYAQNQGSYSLDLKLFGKIHLKDIQVDVVDTRYAVPCGAPVGIYLKSKGIMVIGTGILTDSNGDRIEPAYGVLKSGDYIEALNGEPLKNKEALITKVNALGEESAVLTVRRDGGLVDVNMNAVATEDGDYKLGAWVRDDTQGIGTMTYVDANGSFGALGHGISDSDTGMLVEIEDGSLYETEIMAIEQGTTGKPGVMAGVIYYGPGSQLGSITKNTDEGIFGTVNDQYRQTLQGEPIQIGYRQDVTKGPAILRSCVSGEVKDYEIEIQRVDYNPSQKNKGLVIRVTDQELLKITGGIVQGMSGSPIIQNGKLVGAVTHVFVQDSTRGYGIFIESMLEK